MSEKFVLELCNITKVFPGVRALNSVSLQVQPGEIHALVGENGAGKSTLMKCLFGIYHADSGDIFFKGKKTIFRSAKNALESGVSMIHQELLNIPERSVKENIWLGREPIINIGPLKLLNHKKMLRDTSSLLKRLDLNINPDEYIKNLSISMQQGCEIAKAVSFDASVIIMDEPTSSLTENEVSHLFSIIDELKKKNIAIIYISHKLDEVFKIADRISVMRDGEMIGTYSVEELDEDSLIQKMVGRENSNVFPYLNNATNEILLKVENLTSHDPRSFKNINFELHKGEILGIGGLVGAQRTELVESLFGLRHLSSGKVFIRGEEIKKVKPKKAIKHGMALLTEDRRGTGIFPLLTIVVNTAIPSLSKYKNKIGFLDHKKIRIEAERMSTSLRIKTPSMETLIQNLSGGNQQKVLVGRWLMTVPDILIMDEPTRGIDVGAKFEIYAIIAELIKRGKSIIMVSSEMIELIGLSHRIMVLCDGKHTGTLNRNKATPENIMKLATKFS